MLASNDAERLFAQLNLMQLGCAGLTLQKVERTSVCLCRHNIHVRISFGPGKRDRTLKDRGFDFADAALVFKGVIVEVEGTRRDHGARRIVCCGSLNGRLVVVGYTQRGVVRRGGRPRSPQPRPGAASAAGVRSPASP